MGLKGAEGSQLAYEMADAVSQLGRVTRRSMPAGDVLVEGQWNVT
jgi:hypothetical protein